MRAVAGELAGVSLTFLGDGSSNMAHSYLLGGATAGMRVRICGPAAYSPSAAVTEAARAIAARTGGSVGFDSDPGEACKGADFLATDVWTSMGQEGQEDERIAAMEPFRLDKGGSPPPPAAGACCTASRRIATRRSRPGCWTAPLAWSGTRPRTGCTPRRRC